MLQTYDERNRDLVVNVNGELVHRDLARISPFDSAVQGLDHEKEYTLHAQITGSGGKAIEFTSKPFRAPMEVEMAITRGIASRSACGQAMTSTVAVRMSACCLSPASHQ